MRQILKLRKMDAADRQEQEELLDLYKRAIGPLLERRLSSCPLAIAVLSARKLLIERAT